MSEPFTLDNTITGNDDVPAAIVNIGEVTIDDYNAQFINDGPDTAIWVDYEINNRYEKDGHIYMMGTTSPGGSQLSTTSTLTTGGAPTSLSSREFASKNSASFTSSAGGTDGAGTTASFTSSSNPIGVNSVAFVQLAQPTLLWIADWSAARFNIQPTAPDPTPADPDWVLLDVHLEPSMLILAADAITPLYRLSGTYIYGHKNPAANTFDNINFSRPPWLSDSFNRTMPNTFLQQGLIDLSLVTGSAGGSVGAGAGASLG